MLVLLEESKSGRVIRAHVLDRGGTPAALAVYEMLRHRFLRTLVRHPYTKRSLQAMSFMVRHTTEASLGEYAWAVRMVRAEALAIRGNPPARQRFQVENLSPQVVEELTGWRLPG